MQVSYRWLKEFVDLQYSPEEIAEILTMGGVEVGYLSPSGPDIKGIALGRIETVRPHPYADNLQLCEISTATQRLAIVCGAPNVEEGAVGIVALPGAQLAEGRTVDAVSIRDILSEGMLCSSADLGFSSDHSGIIILSPPCSLDDDIDNVLGLDDIIMELDLTPNRADCLSIVGVAREVAAITGATLHLPEITVKEEGRQVDDVSSVKVFNPDRCPRYAGRVITGIKVRPSPLWLARRLEIHGIRTVNNIVDITNYVLLELGQPLHPFDLHLLDEDRIVVRLAKDGEEVITIDGRGRELISDDLVIADSKHPVAIAGVMGGARTEINDQTVDVFLESAFFESTGVRRTAKRFGFHTEASHRFERGVDPEGVIKAIDRAAEMMRQLAGGTVLAGRLDVDHQNFQPEQIDLRVNRVKTILGIDLFSRDIAASLRRLPGLDVSEECEVLSCTIPSYRPDLEREIDLIEEVARLHGYNEIPVTFPTSQMSSEKIQEQSLEEEMRTLLVSMGFYETIHYGFAVPEDVDRIGLKQEDSRRKNVPLLNPLTEEYTILRTTLIPGLLRTLQRNSKIHDVSCRFFELGKVFHPRQDNSLPEEPLMLTAVMSGQRYHPFWNSEEKREILVDFFDVKGVVEGLLQVLKINDYQFTESSSVPYYYPGKSAAIVVYGKEVGSIGEVHPEVLERFDLQGPVLLFDLEFEQLRQLAPKTISFKTWPKFPPVLRDLAIVVSESIPAAEVMQVMHSSQNTIVQDIQLFDMYQGVPIPQGKKSMAISIRYQSPERTLTEEEVQEVHDKLIVTLEKEVGAEIRT